MQKIKLNLGELSCNAIKEIDNKKSENNLYDLLLYKILKMRIKENYLLLEPNYVRIPFLLEITFFYKKNNYQLIIDGKNKKIIANKIILTNIHKIPLSFLNSSNE